MGLTAADVPDSVLIGLRHRVGDQRCCVTTRDHYHHGSLRESALEIARDIVITRGHDALAMRDLAQCIGVTPAALYRHFSNRGDLLMALAEEGHQFLLRDLQATFADASSPREGLEVAMFSFLAFCEHKPGLFRMMYDDEVIGASDAELRLPSLAKTYRLLFRQFQRALPEAKPRQVRLRMIAMWSTLFGFATIRAQRSLMSYMRGTLKPAVIERAVVAAALGFPPRSS